MNAYTVHLYKMTGENNVLPPAALKHISHRGKESVLDQKVYWSALLLSIFVDFIQNISLTDLQSNIFIRFKNPCFVRARCYS